MLPEQPRVPPGKLFPRPQPSSSPCRHCFSSFKKMKKPGQILCPVFWDKSICPGFRGSPAASASSQTHCFRALRSPADQRSRTSGELFFVHFLSATRIRSSEESTSMVTECLHLLHFTFKSLLCAISQSLTPQTGQNTLSVMMSIHLLFHSPTPFAGIKNTNICLFLYYSTAKGGWQGFFCKK